MVQRDDADEIKDRLNDALEGVLDHFWSGWVKRGKMAYCAPTARKDDLGSFMVYLGSVGKYHRGAWVRSSAGIGGDELNLFAYGLTGHHKATSEVFERAREYVGLSAVREETAEDKERRERLKKAAALKRQRQDESDARDALRKAATVADICRESMAIDGTAAEKYLINRGIPKPPTGWPDCIMFHTGLEWDLGAEYDEEGRKIKSGPIFSGLVARVENVAGETIAIWRIYLTEDGKKAPVSNPKLGLGPAAGGAVRIGGTGPIVGAAEGVESAFGAWSLINYRNPVWACLSTSGMMNVEFPLDVEAVAIFPDGDRPWKTENGELVPDVPAGRRAARRLAERCDEAGIEARMQAEPKMKCDYLDVWNEWQALEGAA